MSSTMLYLYYSWIEINFCKGDEKKVVRRSQCCKSVSSTGRIARNTKIYYILYIGTYNYKYYCVTDSM